MKKQLITVAFAAMVSGSAFAQGYIAFSATGSPVYQTFINGTAAKSSGNVDVAFLIGTGTSLISSIGASSPFANNSTVSSAVWSDLLSDPNYSLAINSSTSGLIQYTTSTGLGAGNIAGSELGVTGLTGGNAYNIIVFGWNSAYSTPQAAQTAGAAVGWYTLTGYQTGTAGNSTVNTLTQQGLSTFGIDNVVATPEPASMVLAGLGGLSLLAFRRKK